MTFIGNDIVDLHDPANRGRSRDTRFLQRVFTGSEQRCIAAAEAPDAILWALWAAKETAYKICSKMNPLSVFSPRLFSVVLSNGDAGMPRSGMVYAPEGPVTVRVFITPDYVHCIGATPLPGILDHALWDIERLCLSREAGRDDPSLAVRRLARRHLAALLRVPEADIDIRRIGDADQWGPPSPYLEGQSVPFELSLSHDGALVACALVASPPALSCPA